MQNKIELEMKRVRTSLIMGSPFFGLLALRLRLIEDKTCKTCWTDGESLGYNPEFVASLSFDERKAIIAHEILHCTNQHHLRRGDRNPTGWNVAADMAINPILMRAAFKLPKGALGNRSETRSAEKIYVDLPKSGNGKSGIEKRKGQGNQSAGQPDPDTPGMIGEIRDAPKQPGKSKSQQAAEWKTATIQAARQAEKAGKLSSDLKRFIDEILNPKVDWTTELRRYMHQVARGDYQWSPPNRRYIHLGLYLPSNTSPTLGEIAIAIDTSGSILDQDLVEFSAEIQAIAGELQPEKIHVIYCDRKIKGYEAFEPQDFPEKLTPTGGGGTSLKPPFDFLEAENVEPVVMLYMTDLQVPPWDFPDEPPYPVLWVTKAEKADVPFGEKILIE